MFILIFVLSAVFCGSDSLQDSYLIKKSTSCPAAGYFYEREISINSSGAKNCYICFCNNEIAFCWKHASKRCKKQIVPKLKIGNKENLTRKENYRIRLKKVNDLNYESKHSQKRKLARQDARKPKTTRKRDDITTSSKLNGIVESYKYARVFRKQPSYSYKRSSNNTYQLKPRRGTYNDEQTRTKLPYIEQRQSKRDDKAKMIELNRRKQLTKLLLKKLSQAILLLSDGDDTDNVIRTKKTSYFSRGTETENEPDTLEMYLKHVLDSINSTNSDKVVKSGIKKREALDFRISQSSLQDLLHEGISLSSRKSSTDNDEYTYMPSTTLQDYHTIIESPTNKTKDSEYYKYTVEEESNYKNSNKPDIITNNPQQLDKQTIVKLLKTPKIQGITISAPISYASITDNISKRIISTEKPKDNYMELNKKMSRFILDNFSINEDFKTDRNANKFNIKPLTIQTLSTIATENTTQPMVNSILNSEDKWKTQNKIVVFRNKKQKHSSKLKRNKKHHMKHKIEDYVKKNIKNYNLKDKEYIAIGNDTNKNTFKFMKKLFKHHLFDDKEQINMFKKINLMKMVCPDQNNCNVSGEKKKILRPKIKQLNNMSNKIYDIIYSIKTQVKLLRNERNMTNPTEVKTVKKELETLDSILRGTFFTNNSKNLTFNQIDRIAKIKNGARIFVESVKKFTATLKYIIYLTSSSADVVNLKENNVLKRILRYAESDEKKYKEQIESTLKNIKALLRKHNIIHNRLLKGLNDIVDRNNNNKHKHKSHIKYEKFNHTKKLDSNISKMDRYATKIITNLNILKDLTMEMDFHKMRLKRDVQKTTDDSEYYDYLLLMMEFLIKQNNNLMRKDTPRPKDGIDVLLDAIRNSPDSTTAPSETKLIKYRVKGSLKNDSIIDAISSRLASLDEDKEKKSYQLRKLFKSIDDSTSSEAKDKDILNYGVSSNQDFSSGDIRFDRAIKSDLNLKERTNKRNYEITTEMSVSKENLRDEEELLALIRPATKREVDIETVILNTRKTEEKNDEQTSKDTSKSSDKSSSEIEESLYEEITDKLTTTKTVSTLINFTENPRTTARDIVRRGKLRKIKDLSVETRAASAYNIDSFSISHENYKNFNYNDLFG